MLNDGGDVCEVSERGAARTWHDMVGTLGQPEWVPFCD